MLVFFQILIVDFDFEFPPSTDTTFYTVILFLPILPMRVQFCCSVCILREKNKTKQNKRVY